MKVEFTRSAVDDLAQTQKFYEEQGAPGTGLRILEELVQKAERLAKFPDSGRIVPEFGMPFLREIIAPPFRIVYRRDANKIWVIRIWRSERLMKL